MSTNENYLKAVQAGDLSAVKSYLGSHPDEVDINYQDVKLCSALHRTIQCTRNSHEMVKLLIEAGIDCGLRNEQNQIAAEMAGDLGRCDLMILMLEWEFRDMPLCEIFYQLLRRNSMDLVCVYTNTFKVPFAEATSSLEEAYEALRMKGVVLEEQTQYEVLQELIKHYGADRTTCRRQDIAIGKGELLEYISFVLQNTDEDNLNEVSDEVLMAMREVVKQMYLGKERYDEALMEVQHCLSAFVLNCDGTRGVGLYSLFINKQLVLKFLRFVAKQFRQNSSKLSSRDRAVRKQLRKTFVLLKEFHSVQKIIAYLSVACKVDLTDPKDRTTKQLCMDRCVQVVGEAIKSTKLSPNLSRRMQTAFEFMVSAGTASRYRSVRELHSHGYPVAKYLLEKENDFSSYIELQRNFIPTLNFFESMRSTLIIVVQKRFFSSLYKLKTVGQVRSLATYADEIVFGIFEDPAAHHETLYGESMSIKLVDKLKLLLKDDSKNYNALLHLEQRIQSHFKYMFKLWLSHIQLANSFRTLLQAARTCQNISDIRSVLKSALLCPGPKHAMEFYSKHRQLIGNLARTLYYTLMHRYGDRGGQHIVDISLQLYNILDRESASGLERVQLKRTNFTSVDYVEEILRKTGAYEYYKDIPSNIRKNLRKNVEKNVYDVEKRFRILALPDSPRLRAFRTKHEQEFQDAFERMVATLKSFIVTHPTGNALFQYEWKVSNVAFFAIEHLLLNICEILSGVGFNQLNLHHLVHRIPIVCGKNLRDGLAHDLAMYDVIGGSRAQYVSNVIYYGTLCVKLYDKKDWPKSAPFKKVGSSTLRDKLQWFKLQRTLYDHLKTSRDLILNTLKSINLIFLDVEERANLTSKCIVTTHSFKPYVITPKLLWTTSMALAIRRKFNA